MKIQAGEFELIPFKDIDEVQYYELAHDQMVKKYVPYAYPIDRKAAKEIVQVYSNGDSKNDFYLLIRDKQNFIGMIIAVRTTAKVLDTSAFLIPEYRNKGIMTIVMQAFIKWLSENTAYEELIMLIEKNNIASNIQIKKIGGVFQSLYKNNYVYKVFLK